MDEGMNTQPAAPGTDTDTDDRPRGRKRAALLVGGLIGTVGLTGGIVVALWSASGTGSGSAKAITAQSLTITAAAAPTADLYPGASGALQFTVNNPNPYGVTLTSWSSGTVTSSDPTNCPASNVTAGSGTLGVPLVVAGGATSSAQSIAGGVTMLVAAPNGCQGVTFTVALTLTGTQS